MCMYMQYYKKVLEQKTNKPNKNSTKTQDTRLSTDTQKTEPAARKIQGALQSGNRVPYSTHSPQKVEAEFPSPVKKGNKKKVSLKEIE